MIKFENIKALIFDLDNTLLRPDKTISPYTASVLFECKKRSIKLMIATARPERAVADFLKATDFDAMTVSNGGRVIFGKSRVEKRISFNTAEKLLTVLKSTPHLPITLETGDCAYSNIPIDEYETIVCEDLISIAKAKGSMKLLAHTNNGELLGSIKKELPEDVYFTVAHGDLMQIMSRSATKWKGIEMMLSSVGILPENAVYFGDDHDDIEPIKRCGVGVAVANGTIEAKAAADHIAESNDRDGVAKFIKQNLLK